MNRPVRPVALVLLTICMVYPGVTMLFQGLYPFVAFEYFTLKGDPGVWTTLLGRFGVPELWVNLIKAGVGAAWTAGVLGLWAGDWRAYPLALLAAAASLLHPGGPMIMGMVALVCLIVFREKASEVTA